MAGDEEIATASWLRKRSIMSSLLEIEVNDFDSKSLLEDLSVGKTIVETETAIKIRGLRKNYGHIEAVRGVDLEIKRGEIFGLIGPDGAGKTSVFQILGGVMEATEGAAIVFGRPGREVRSSIGYLTQAFSLYQDLSVEENILYMGELRGLSIKESRQRGMRYLKLFDMDRFTDRLAGKLSGGMKQKLALSCALIIEPKTLLL